MFNTKTINQYKDISKEFLIKWIRILIENMHVNLNIKNDDFEYIDKLMDLYIKNLITIAIIRKEAFKLHEKARSSIDISQQLLYRIYGQALSTIHVKTHAFHSANYILKLYKLNHKETELIYAYQLRILESAYEVT